MVEFFEWWNIDNLMPEDYQPFKMYNGKKIMSLAEQAYIAYSKALLKLKLPTFHGLYRRKRFRVTGKI